MSTLALPSFLQSFRTRWRFKFTLPTIRRAKLHGIRLDVSGLSPMMKNHILQERYEQQECLLAQKVLKPEDVVLELGGAIGFIGLFCRLVLRVRHHVSVEPNPNTIAMLRRNYDLNHLQPQLIEAAASASNGRLKLDISGEFWENSLVSRSRDRAHEIEVPTMSLPSIVAEMPASPTALICDIEGAETHLDFSQLPQTVTRIIIELHPSITGEEAAERVAADIRSQGFRLVERQENTWLFCR